MAAQADLLVEPKEKGEAHGENGGGVGGTSRVPVETKPSVAGEASARPKPSQPAVVAPKSAKPGAAKREGPKSQPATPGDRTRGRGIVWDANVNEYLIIALCAVYKEQRGIEINWTGVARQIHPDMTGQAVSQHVGRLRKSRLERGDIMPPGPLFNEQRPQIVEKRTRDSAPNSATRTTDFPGARLRRRLGKVDYGADSDDEFSGYDLEAFDPDEDFDPTPPSKKRSVQGILKQEPTSGAKKKSVGDLEDIMEESSPHDARSEIIKLRMPLERSGVIKLRIPPEKLQQLKEHGQIRTPEPEAAKNLTQPAPQTPTRQSSGKALGSPFSNGTKVNSAGRYGTEPKNLNARLSEVAPQRLQPASDPHMMHGYAPHSAHIPSFPRLNFPSPQMSTSYPRAQHANQFGTNPHNYYGYHHDFLGTPLLQDGISGPVHSRFHQEQGLYSERRSSSFPSSQSTSFFDPPSPEFDQSSAFDTSSRQNYATISAAIPQASYGPPFFDPLVALPSGFGLGASNAATNSEEVNIHGSQDLGHDLKFDDVALDMIENFDLTVYPGDPHYKTALDPETDPFIARIRQQIANRNVNAVAHAGNRLVDQGNGSSPFVPLFNQDNVNPAAQSSTTNHGLVSTPDAFVHTAIGDNTNQAVKTLLSNVPAGELPTEPAPFESIFENALGDSPRLSPTIEQSDFEYQVLMTEARDDDHSISDNADDE